MQTVLVIVLITLAVVAGFAAFGGIGSRPVVRRRTVVEQPVATARLVEEPLAAPRAAGREEVVERRVIRE